jgi:DNA-binding FrmR family transcriptional regulator
VAINKQEKSLLVEQKIIEISTNINSLIEMVEHEFPCTKLLCQINSIQWQLQELKSTLFIREINECTATIQNNSEVSVQFRELAKLRDLFEEKNITKIIHNYEVNQ